jgi:hypothetical protein
MDKRIDSKMHLYIREKYFDESKTPFGTAKMQLSVGMKALKV